MNMLQLKVNTMFILILGNDFHKLSSALSINENLVSWAVAGDQIIITLQGMDIAKIK